MPSSAIKVPMGRPKSETYPNHIAEFVRRTGGRVTQQMLADICSVTQPTMNALIQGQTRLSVERAQIIAPVLRCEWWELSENLENTYKSMQFKESKKSMLKEVPHSDNENIRFGPDTVPILGHANGSPDAVVINMDNEIGRALRHPNQQGLKDGFALYAAGDSMSPRYRPGELVYVAAKRPPIIGQDCIVEMTNSDGFLKEFVKFTDKDILCKQLNPPREWKRPLSEVKAVHAVVGRG